MWNNFENLPLLVRELLMSTVCGRQAAFGKLERRQQALNPLNLCDGSAWPDPPKKGRRYQKESGRKRGRKGGKESTVSWCHTLRVAHAAAARSCLNGFCSALFNIKWIHSLNTRAIHLLASWLCWLWPYVVVARSKRFNCNTREWEREALCRLSVISVIRSCRLACPLYYIDQ